MLFLELASWATGAVPAPDTVSATPGLVLRLMFTEDPHLLFVMLSLRGSGLSRRSEVTEVTGRLPSPG